MKKLLVLLVACGLFAYSCTKEGPCGCSSPPLTEYLGFVLVDKDSNSIIKSKNVYNYSFYYMLEKDKKYINMHVSDSFPRYKCFLFSDEPTILSANNQVQEFYLISPEKDIDTVWVDAKKDNGDNYIINEVKFNGKKAALDTVDYQVAFVFRKETP